MQADTPVPGTAIAEPMHTATIGKRFWNNIIDVICASAVSWPLSALVMGATSSVVIQMVVSWISFGLFYVFFESIWQRTPGKWVTETKVVNLDGTKPSFLRIVGRSLCRDIPFEVLSFLFGEYPYGWHDRISKTMVVPVTYTPAEAASVDPYNKGKTSTVIVTLVILLFALPVLGLVSAVVLASIGHAKQEGTNSALQADMANVRLQAEIYFNQNNSFQGFCASTQAIAPLEHASQISVQTPSAYICNDSTDHWAASVPLLPAGYWCVDDSDNPPASTTASLGTQMSCDWLSLPSPAESVPGPTGF